MNDAAIIAAIFMLTGGIFGIMLVGNMLSKWHARRCMRCKQAQEENNDSRGCGL